MATPKRLRRSVTQKVVLGVCGGLAEYLDIDAVPVRLLFAVVTFFTGIFPGLVVYLILGIAMPKGDAPPSNPSS